MILFFHGFCGVLYFSFIHISVEDLNNNDNNKSASPLKLNLSFVMYLLCLVSCCCKFQLPFKVDIIKDPSELDGKSTAVHAAILAPPDVTVYQFPDIPDYTSQTQVTYYSTQYFIIKAIKFSFQLDYWQLYKLNYIPIVSSYCKLYEPYV